jgi:hypothetical protein
MRSARLVTSAGILAAGFALGAPAVRGAGDDSCLPRGAKELARSKETRVYRQRRGRDVTTVACHRRTARVNVLGSSEQGLYVYPAFALRGPLVAYALEDQSDPVSPTLTSIRIDNVRTGRPVPGWTLADPGHDTTATVTSIVVARDGSVGWIACNETGSEGVPNRRCADAGIDMRVYRMSARADQAEQLDEGTAIEPRSLRLVGSNLKWRSGGVARVAPIR